MVNGQKENGASMVQLRGRRGTVRLDGAGRDSRARGSYTLVHNAKAECITVNTRKGPARSFSWRSRQLLSLAQGINHLSRRRHAYSKDAERAILPLYIECGNVRRAANDDVIPSSAVDENELAASGRGGKLIIVSRTRSGRRCRDCGCGEGSRHNSHLNRSR